MFIFSCVYVNMKPRVTLKLFSAFKGEYPVSFMTSGFEFRRQTAFQINLLPFFIAFIKRNIEMD